MRLLTRPRSSPPTPGPRPVSFTVRPTVGPTTAAVSAARHKGGLGAAVESDDAIALGTPYERYGKRALDLVFLAAVLPVALVIALPIALWNWVEFQDMRQVLFLQRRVGLRGRTFWIYKFRTMREPAKKRGAWSLADDVARTTRFGRFLRNTHLDELPQLLNILKGDMHLVGPRPEMVDVHQWACGEVPGFARRLATAPGLTGRAQVSQGYTVREAESYAAKLAIDLAYLRATSLRQDLGIIARTIPWVLRGRGWGWNRGAGATSTTVTTPASAAAVADPSLATDVAGGEAQVELVRAA